VNESIEKVKPSDIDCIKQIEIQSSLSSWSKADYLIEIDRTDSLFYLARGDKDILGFILARLIMKDTYDSKPTFNISNNTEIEIYNIAVKKQFRRSMIGSRLLDKISSRAQEILAEKIFLEARKSNFGAIAFYKKHGFEVTGIRKNFYTNPPEDAILMTRHIELLQNP